MTGENRSKINQILQVWPPGTVATQSWLEEQNVYQQLAYEYERSHWLKRIGQGAYIRQGDQVDWTGGVYALQRHTRLKTHVGGKSALELRGLAHFIPVGTGAYLYLFGTRGEKIPSWFKGYDWKRRLAYNTSNLFNNHELGLTKHSMDRYEITVSTSERAYLELLHLVPKKQSVEEAFLIMEGLVTLRPKLLQELLESCRSIKVKRLFLYIAEKYKQQWFKKIDTSKINLGKGKRVITIGGHLDPKYQITVPNDTDYSAEEVNEKR